MTREGVLVPRTPCGRWGRGGSLLWRERRCCLLALGSMPSGATSTPGEGASRETRKWETPAVPLVPGSLREPSPQRRKPRGSRCQPCVVVQARGGLSAPINQLSSMEARAGLVGRRFHLPTAQEATWL